MFDDVSYSERDMKDISFYKIVGKKLNLLNFE